MQKYQSIFVPSSFEKRFEFVLELGEALEHMVGSNRVLFRTVIGGLPLMNIVFVGQTVGIMGVVTLTHLKIVKPDSSGQASKIVKLDALLRKEANDLVSLGVRVIDDFSLLGPRVVASIGNWP